jgi:hypothetical protein
MAPSNVCFRGNSGHRRTSANDQSRHWLPAAVLAVEAGAYGKVRNLPPFKNGLRCARLKIIVLLLVAAVAIWILANSPGGGLSPAAACAGPPRPAATIAATPAPKPNVARSERPPSVRRPSFGIF